VLECIRLGALADRSVCPRRAQVSQLQRFVPRLVLVDPRGKGPGQLAAPANVRHAASLSEAVGA
jgi:hypothetical protein